MITDADREAAWAVRPFFYREDCRERWMAGVYDNVHGSRIQAFARHRTASTAALTAENQRLREAADGLQQAEAKYRQMFDFHGGGSKATFQAWHEMRRAGDRVRAALSTSSEPIAEREALEGPAVPGDVSLHEAWRDLHNAMLHDQRTVGFRLDLWNRLEDIISRPSGEPISDHNALPGADGLCFEPLGARR